jgi:hypothetical protein
MNADHGNDRTRYIGTTDVLPVVDKDRVGGEHVRTATYTRDPLPRAFGFVITPSCRAPLPPGGDVPGWDVTLDVHLVKAA